MDLPELDVGEQVTIHHEGCNNRQSSKALSVKRDHDGYVYYCHKCGASGSIRNSDTPLDTGSISKLKAKSTTSGNTGTNNSRRFVIPNNAVRQIGAFDQRVRDWLDGYDITSQDVADASLYCHDNKLYVPFSGNAGQVRNFTVGYDGPKWIYKGPNNERKYLCAGPSNGVLVVCEDPISSIKLAHHCTALCVAGTSLSKELVYTLSDVLNKMSINRILVFFDDDNVQVKSQQLRAKRTLDIFRETTIIKSGGKDPKEHSHQELEDIIRSYSGS